MTSIPDTTAQDALTPRDASPSPWLATERVEVPGRPGVFVVLRLRRDHHIMVERPDIFVEGVPEEGMTYDWPLGVPDPKRASVPTAATELFAGEDDPGMTQPLLAAAAVGRVRGRLDAATRAACQAAWKDVWTRFSKHLDPEAAALARQYHLAAPLYSLLAQRPDLRDHVKVAPALAPFYEHAKLAEVPASGWNLNMIMAHLIPESYRHSAEGKIRPGTAAWMKNMSWDASRHGAMPKTPSDWAREARKLVRHAHELGQALDPNRIQQIKEDRDWTLLHVTMGHPGAAPLIGPVMLNPGSALKAIDQYLRPQGEAAPTELSERILHVLNDVIRWRAEEPEVAARVSGFKKMVEEAVLWDRAMRQDSNTRGDRIAELRVARMILLEEAARRAVMEAGLCRAIAMNRSAYTLRAGVEPNERFHEEEIPVVSFGGYTLEELVTPAALQWESMRTEFGGMNHCVVTHVESCRRGDSRVFTVRRPRRKPDDYGTRIEAFRQQVEAASLRGEGTDTIVIEWKAYELTHRDTPIGTYEVNAGDFQRIREHKGPGNAAVAEVTHEWVKLALRVAEGKTTLDLAVANWGTRVGRNIAVGAG